MATETLELTVDVTAEHIANGRRHWCNSCPVALAVEDVLPQGVLGVSVGIFEIKFIADGVFYRAATPEKAVSFITAFDRNETVEPFAFPVTVRPDGRLWAHQ